MEKYAREMEAEVGVKVVTMSSADEAARGADIIFTVTTADTALIHNESIAQGATVVSMGSYQELDDALVLSVDKVLVDNLEQCVHRGELAHLFEQGELTEEDIYGELGEVVAGLKPGRQSLEERILVVPIGLGSLDIAVAHRAFSRAVKKGIGRRFAFSA